MTFLLKKTISLFLLPLPFGLILSGIGLILLTFKKYRRSSAACLLLGFIILIFFSTPIISYQLINQLQSKYKPLVETPNDVTKIVVLGGGISGGKNYPPNISLNAASLSRLIEGIRQFRQLNKQDKNPKLILSGGRVFQSYITTAAGEMRNTAVMLGIPSANMRLENGTRDTYQEALYLKKTLGTEPFILVTSAYHMPRAMELFERQGMHPIAAPTQFLNMSAFKLKTLIPNQTGLLMSDLAIHEYLGILWARLNNEIKS